MPLISSNFAVQLDGLRLTSAAKKRISAAIGAAVDKELAGIDTGGDSIVLSRIPPGLDGKWIRVLRNTPDLNRVFPKEEFRFK